MTPAEALARIEAELAAATWVVGPKGAAVLTWRDGRRPLSPTYMAALVKVARAASEVVTAHGCRTPLYGDPFFGNNFKPCGQCANCRCRAALDALTKAVENCCVCNGSCNHVGPHSYCVAHGGSVFYPSLPTAVPTFCAPLPPQPAFGFRFVPSVCEHCFCQPAGPVLFESGHLGGVGETAINEPEHEQCCNCGVRRVKQAVES